MLRDTERCPVAFVRTRQRGAARGQLLPQGDAQRLLFAEDRERWRAKTGHSRRGLGRGEKMLHERTWRMKDRGRAVRMALVIGIDSVNILGKFSAF